MMGVDISRSSTSFYLSHLGGILFGSVGGNKNNQESVLLNIKGIKHKTHKNTKVKTEI